MEKHSLNESILLIEEISDTFVKFLGNILELTNSQKINLVGIGNSISAGWTAIDSNVEPWIKKMSPFIYDKCVKAGINIEFASFAIAGENSNEKIFDFLKGNPDLEEVRNHFIRIFDKWKDVFKGTLFENYVDKNSALEFYKSEAKNFFDYFGDDTFTITSFNGCTGELLENTKSLFKVNGLNLIMQKELIYLQQILSLVIELSSNSYVTVGNFPKMARNYLAFLNILIKRINNKIKETVFQNERTLYFDDINLDLFEKYKEKIKIDNHPNLERQYYALYKYMIYLMNNLPLSIMQSNNDYDITHYKAFDYDGKLELRMKNQLNR